MKLSVFPRCCGASNFHSLPYEYGLPYEETKAQTILAQRRVDRYLKNIEDRTTDASYVAFIFTILTDVQKKYFGSLLHRYGWKLVDKRKNPSSAHVLYVYLYRPTIEGLD